MRARQEMMPPKEGGMRAPFSDHQSMLALLSWLEQGALSSQPRIQDLAMALKACRRHHDRALAARLYLLLQNAGLEKHPYLGNYLVPMLVDVGCIQDAQQVFDKLSYINEWSWDSLISGCVNHGMLQRALCLYNRMPKDSSIQPLTHTFVSLLKACKKLKVLKYGLEIHADVAKRGLITKDLFIGSALLDFYAKCGFLAKAQEVFDSLPRKDTACWTALIAGYVECGSCQEALFCFGEMQNKNILPDAVAFVCALKACATMQAESDGEQIHVELERQGLLDRNIIIGNALVDMYSKCGLLRRANDVFDKLPEKNVISWTALIAGYSEYGSDQEVLNCYKQMQNEGVLPNSVTYMSILKSCGSMGALQTGCQIHSIIISQKLSLEDLVVTNALLGMYAKSGALTLAYALFESLETRNPASWAILILGYTEEGSCEEALDLYKRMQAEGAFPDTIIYICGLKCCSMVRAGDKGGDIHAEIERRGFVEVDELIGNTLVDMYGKCGLLSLAKQVFTLLPIRDVVSWTALISGYIEHGYFEEALKCFEKMLRVGVSPNVVTYVCALKACSAAKATEKGRQIHIDIAKQGIFDGDIAICNILVDIYAKSGLLVTAHQMFNKLSVQTTVSWSTLISGYSEHGCSDEAINLFEQMQLEGVFADAGAIVCVLKACCNVGALLKGQEIHAEIERQGILGSELIGNTLVTMYANSGLLARAQQVFDKLPLRDVVSWTALMAGYSQVADIEKVFCTYKKMEREGLMPDPVTYAVILNACGCSGSYSLSHTFFEAMSKEYGVNQAFDHRISLVNALLCSGQLVDAETIVRQIPDCSTSLMWNAFLSSCKRWGDIDSAEKAFKIAVLPDEGNIMSSSLQVWGLTGKSNKNGLIKKRQQCSL